MANDNPVVVKKIHERHLGPSVRFRLPEKYALKLWAMLACPEGNYPAFEGLSLGSVVEAVVNFIHDRVSKECCPDVGIEKRSDGSMFLTWRGPKCLYIDEWLRVEIGLKPEDRSTLRVSHSMFDGECTKTVAAALARVGIES